MKLMTKKQQQLSPTEPVLNESDMFLEIFYPDFVKISYALLEKEKRKDFSFGKNRRRPQCDQMARLFFQYLAIHNNDVLSNYIKKFAKIGFTFCQLLNEPSKFCKMPKSGHTEDAKPIQ